METLLIVLHVIVCTFLMLTVLLQSGKSGGMGSAFGGGGNTASVFGGAGSNPFLQKLTTWAAVIFMLTSIFLAYVASNANKGLKDRSGADAAKAAESEAALKKELEALPQQPTPSAAPAAGEDAAAIDGNGAAPAPSELAAPEAPVPAPAAAAPTPAAAPAPAAPTPAAAPAPAAQ